MKKRIRLHFNEVIPTHAYDEHWYGAFGTGICLGGYAASNRCFVLSLLGNVYLHLLDALISTKYYFLNI